MTIKSAVPAAVLGLGVLLLSACGGNSGGAPAAAAGTAGSSAASTDLRTTNTAFGTIVVDAKGRTVYAFDKDTKGSGASACSGACAGLWPAVTVSGATPSVTGVNGKVGTIKRSDGSTQVTLDGRPLYRYAGDSGAGDTTGQGVKGVWWVVAPSGAEITTTPGPTGY